VDTDQLIPARFMKQPRSAGYGSFLLHDLRFDAGGARRPGFALDEPRYAGARTLVARRNFGTGSSREAAVYALWDHGVRVVVAPSFGDIFASNAVKNGLLPATVSEADAEALLQFLQTAKEPQLTVDLEACKLEGGALQIVFAIDPARRLQLLNGWDDLDLTELRREEISRYRRLRAADAPWAFPPARRSTS
jgi:3-isopropylmalate/(R)-2-methylmalate dehydratase small subunit